MPDAEKKEPITREEIKRRMMKIWETREQQDAELRQKYGLTVPVSYPQEFLKRPLTRKEITEKVSKLIEDRQRQDEEVGRKYGLFLFNHSNPSVIQTPAGINLP